MPESEINRILRLEGERLTVGYARFSSAAQRDNLDRQKQLIIEYARRKGCGEIEVISDIGSGLNEKREQRGLYQAFRRRFQQEGFNLNHCLRG